MNTEKIKNIVREIIGNIQPRSIYACGNWVGKKHRKDSNLNILIISEKDKLDFDFLKEFAEKDSFFNPTILTMDEIKNDANASFNSFCYINLLFSSILLYGEDILLKESTKFLNFDSALRKVESILQRIRNILNKSYEESYWFRKLNHRIYPIISEFLFLTNGYYNSNISETKNKFEELFFKLNASSLKDLYEIFSRIKEMYLSYSSQPLKIRAGIFVLIRDKFGRYLMLERADKQGFEFVKGGIEMNESSVDAALRELREEIGITIARDKLIELPIALSFRFPRKDGYEIRIYKGFLVIEDNINPQALTLDNFFSSAQFMELEEISKQVSFPEYYRIAEEVSNLLGENELILNLNKIKNELSSV